MTTNSDDVIISGAHLDLTQALKDTGRDKVGKLFRHESHIIRVRIELGYNAIIQSKTNSWRRATSN